MSTPGPLDPRTAAVHAGRHDLASMGVHAAPIDLSSTSPLPEVEAGGEAYEQLAGGGRPSEGQSFVYQRLWNPTVARFEDALAELEHTDEAVAFASGMAAVAASLLACVAAGTPHVVAVRPLYGGTDHLLGTGLLGTEVSWVEADGITAAITERTGLVVVETPANPTLELVDLDAVVAAAGDVPVLVDNTFATPILQNPANHGVALVLHSLTKAIGGHGDLLGGAIACTSEWAARLRQVRAVTGGLLAPQVAYTAHRGLQSLAVRVEAATRTAEEVARWLAARPEVAAVHYPGLATGADAELVARQMRGAGSMIAFRLAGGYAAASAVAQSCQMIVHAVSLGGVDSLIQHPAALTHRPVPAEARPAADVLRLSIGLESAQAIIADLEQALAQLA